MDEHLFLDRHTALAERHNQINPELHKRYNTKRGLRNEDGTGVLIGLTEIGEVHGYIIDDQERVPSRGRLSYRGINVEELVRACERESRFGFEETVYLLLFGELPNAETLREFTSLIGAKRKLPDGFVEDMVLKAPSKDIMNKLGRAVLAAYSYDGDPEDLSLRNVLRQAIELIARFPQYVASAYQAKRHYFHGESLVLHAPDESLSTAENFLAMIRTDRAYTALEAQTLDLALTLHAEHGGGNNSAFTVHVVSSSATDTYSAIAAGVGSLKGAKHGGAANRVAEMMADIMSNVADWQDERLMAAYLARILRKEVGDRSGLIYGLGHAVYTLSDPRAELLKVKARTLAEWSGNLAELDLLELIARIAPAVFREAKGSEQHLAPNVDFYSGFVYRMLGIPQELFTPIFAIARVPGWTAHRIEELVSGGRIIRPAYKNVLGQRPYVTLADRR